MGLILGQGHVPQSQVQSLALVGVHVGGNQSVYLTWVPGRYPMASGFAGGGNGLISIPVLELTSDPNGKFSFPISHPSHRQMIKEEREGENTHPSII